MTEEVKTRGEYTSSSRRIVTSAPLTDGHEIEEDAEGQGVLSPLTRCEKKRKRILLLPGWLAEKKERKKHVAEEGEGEEKEEKKRTSVDSCAREKKKTTTRGGKRERRGSPDSTRSGGKKKSAAFAERDQKSRSGSLRQHPGKREVFADADAASEEKDAESEEAVGGE